MYYLNDVKKSKQYFMSFFVSLKTNKVMLLRPFLENNFKTYFRISNIILKNLIKYQMLNKI